MHGRPVDDELGEAERIAQAYRAAAAGDSWAALVQAVSDALADLAEAERRTLRRDRLISRGYIRAGVPASEARP
jgi:hypothetical protein